MSVSPTDGIGPTQEQRKTQGQTKTPTRVGIEPTTLALLMELGPHKDTQRITLTRVGIEPTTFGFDHGGSTD